MSDYPEHDKLQAIRKERDAVQGFYDWLVYESEFDIGRRHKHADRCLCDHEWHLGPRLKPARVSPRQPECPLCFSRTRSKPTPICGYSQGQFQSAGVSPEQLLAQYFGIDLAALSREKEEMLEDIRRRHREVSRPNERTEGQDRH